MDVAVAEFHDKIVLSFRKFGCPHPKSHLLENCNEVRAANVFVESVFIIVVMGCRDKVIRHHNYCTEIVILLMSIKLLEVVQ